MGSSIASIETSVPVDGAVLAGTLTRPNGADAVVLTIHGTGPLDRDENFRGQSLNVFNAIAEDLAKRGIATFRYDKRGCGNSSGDYYTAGHFDVVADAAACLNHLKAGSLGHFRRFYLLGHSEGTAISAEIAAGRDDVDGLILLNPFLQPMEEVLMAQAERMEEALRDASGIGGILMRLLSRVFGSPRETQKRLIARIKASAEPVLRFMLRRLPAKSLRELLSLDLPSVYAKVKHPALVLAGGKDLQCDPADAARITALIGPSATALVMPDLTHILRNDPDEHSLLAYRQLIKQPVAPEVLTTIGGWLVNQEAGR